jgi:uncharacterized protein (TIGR02996 family)
MTAQAQEIIRYKGETYGLCANPLVGADVELPSFDRWSTGCRRGYIGTWEVVDDVLYFVDIDATKSDGKPLLVTDLFPGSSGKVRADWVTDRLRVPQGELLQYLHAEYASIYERDMFMSVWGGRVALIEVFDNEEEKLISSETTAQLHTIFGPEESAFISEIRTTPNDRMQRLVYADWLEERNDPRGALIRLEDERFALNKTPTAEEWLKRDDAELRVKNWLWMKLLGYPLPLDLHDREIFHMGWLQLARWRKEQSP